VIAAEQVGKDKPGGAGTPADRAVRDQLILAVEIDGGEDAAQVGDGPERSALVVQAVDGLMDRFSPAAICRSSVAVRARAPWATASSRACSSRSTLSVLSSGPRGSLGRSHKLGRHLPQAREHMARLGLITRPVRDNDCPMPALEAIVRSVLAARSVPPRWR
jgi:hypothetical protein